MLAAKCCLMFFMDNKMKKNKQIRRFDVAAYELFNNGLFRQKVIPNKKKAEKLKRKKVDLREYRPFFVFKFLLQI